MVHNLSEKNSIANQFLLELRDCKIQSDSMRFRRNMERLGSIMAYEISKKLNYTNRKVETPLGFSNAHVPEYSPVLITVLRAGLAYFNGFINFFDSSESGFIGAYRSEQEKEKEIKINLDYLATPSLDERDVILIDPMLATGRSFIKSIQSLTKRGRPKHIYIAALVSAPEGIRYIESNMSVPYSIWTFSVDEKLNDQFYIVPGLGDAGDLSFGEKI
ncbi:MAG TPA: uracil phosphoribosyltransferase [Cyclobacteriaceae bacterium]|nr:uracil phosphoribosyltransferase [Cyclobacteriaceae bacterium]